MNLLRSGERGHTALASQGARLQFVAHLPHLFGSRAHKYNPLLRARLRQIRRLGEESVAGMDCIRSRTQGGCNDNAEIQIALCSTGRPNTDGGVCKPSGQAVSVSIRNGQHGFNSECLACPDNADGNLATIGDQYAGDRHLGERFAPARPEPDSLFAKRTLNRTCSYSTNCASCTQISVITPLTPARTAVNTFMTSISATVVSAVISSPTATNGAAPGSGLAKNRPIIGATIVTVPS